MKTATEIGFKVSSLIPLAFLASGAIFVVRAYYSLGKWPQPYQPDPKDLGFNVHMWVVYILFLLSLLSPIFVWGSWLDVKKYKINIRPYAWIFALSALATILVVVFDPGHFLEWFCD